MSFGIISVDSDIKQKQIDQLKSCAKKCVSCPVKDNMLSQLVFGSGSVNAKLMLISEAPGKHDAINGVPFTGMVGELLDKMLAGIGMLRKDVFLTSVIQCQPPDGRDPSLEEIRSCAGSLFSKIAIIQPKLIVALGTTSAYVLLGKKVKVSAARSMFGLNFQGIPVVCTYHPAALLRDADRKQYAWADFEDIKKRLSSL